MKVPHKIFILVLSTFLGLTTSCSSTTKKNDVSNQSNDTIDHGYNELANPSDLKTISNSDYNRDNPEIENIARPKTSTVQTQLDTTALFQSWVKDPNGPCTDFVISNKSFYIADYAGDGAMPYELIEKKLKVFYNDFIQEGEIISVTTDTLKIRWKDIDEVTAYVRWAQ
ncbi:MAG: hypothetical protein PHX49_09415 [Bacteroidales bacterium]|nr:hypothetical protein [Bacteroidales bacterium]